MFRWIFLMVMVVPTAGAQTEVPYFEAITVDSALLFLEFSMFSSGRASFTGKDCAKGFRATRIAADGKFEGRFRDFQFERPHQLPKLRTEGNYQEGKKEGQFLCYYLDGQTRLEGLYVSDLPSGEWKFYSPQGVLALVLRFDGRPEPLIDYLFDERSQLELVKNGNGEARFISHGETPYAVSGRIKDGLPDGEWIGEMEVMGQGGRVGKWTRKETYRAGKMVAGKKYQSGRITDVCCSPELARFFPTPEVSELLYLEAFPVEACPSQIQVPSPNAPPPPPRSAVPVSDLLIFQSSVKSIILAKYQGRQVGESFNPTGMDSEENQVIIHFNTDEKGRPVKVRLASGYGREFFQPIRRALESQTTWSPNQTRLVLTVFVRMTPSVYSYRIAFTLE